MLGKGMDNECEPYYISTTSGFHPSGCSGSLVSDAVQPDHTSITQPTAQIPPIKRPLEDIMSEDIHLESEPAAKRKRTNPASLVLQSNRMETIPPRVPWRTL
ncbi:unnamed protein product [Lota lota]